MSLEWLNSLCNPDAAHKSPKWSMLRCPLRFRLDGEWRVAATDGHIFAVVRGDGVACLDATEAETERLLKVIADNPAVAFPVLRTTAAELAAWVGPHEPDKLCMCLCCGGDGQCQCEKCGAHHNCGACDGTGKQSEYVMRPGVLVGVCIDRNLLAKALPHLSGDVAASVKFTKDAPAGILRLDGLGWFVIIVGMSPTTEHGDCPQFLAVGVTT